MKKLIVLLLVALTGCGEYTPPVNYTQVAYPTTYPTNYPTPYPVVRCYNYYTEYCGFTAYNCSNGLYYKCLNYFQLGRLVNGY